jgi:pimeloyl-ACP methyl ester carboxylesterase
MSARKTLLLLPGLACDAKVWSKQVAALQSEYETVVADYGQCDSHEGMARVALELMGNRATVAVAGHSMGGRVALELYRLAGDRISHLALMDTGYKPMMSGAAGAAERAARRQLMAVAEDRGMRAMAEQWVPGIVHPDRVSDDALVADILDMMGSCPIGRYRAQVKALLDRPDASSLLPTIQCPTLILVGEQDLWSPVAQHREMADHIRHSRCKIIAACGHMCTMEQPAAVMQMLRSWLREQAAL